MQTAETGEALASPSDKKAVARERMAKARAAKKPKAAIPPGYTEYTPPVVAKPAINKDLIGLHWDMAKNQGRGEYARTEQPKPCVLKGYSITGQDFSPQMMHIPTTNGKSKQVEKPFNMQGIIFDGSDFEGNNCTKVDARWASWVGCDPVKLKNNIWDGADFRGGLTHRGVVIGEGNTPKPWE